MIQGLCVLAMVWLHLFDTWDYEGLFLPFIFFQDIPLAVYVAQLSDFCVMGFAFCSGYAHYILSEKKDYYAKRLKSLLKLAIKYWTVLIVFTFISMLIGKQSYMPGSWKKFLLSVFFFDSYNGAWWYLLVYFLIVVISPFLLRQAKERPFWLIFICCTALYCSAYYCRFRIVTSNIVLNKLGPLGMKIVEYLIGAIAAKYHYFTTASRVKGVFSKLARIIFSVITITVLLYIRTQIVPSLFFAPASGMVVITLFQLWEKPDYIKRFFLLIGEHSTHIWLIHMFFYLYLFRGMVYKATYPLLIFTYMIVLTLFVSTILNYIEKITFSLMKL